MKILILGGKGMAGHVITSYFKQKPQYEVVYTSRDLGDKEGLYVDVTNATDLEKLMEQEKPDITINCIGILNHHAEQHSKLAFHVNSVLPHQLVKLTERYQGKLIHISTDCVFLGDKGNYTESDAPDGTSIYAQSKQLGEIISDKHLTLRTSIIGPELKTDGIGLFLWFMKQTGKIKGYKRALWNGVTTIELAKAIEVFIQQDVTGLYHLATEPKISKFDLLQLMKEVFQKDDVTIEEDEVFVLDRTIKNTRIDHIYTPPTYRVMLEEMKDWIQKQ